MEVTADRGKYGDQLDLGRRAAFQKIEGWKEIQERCG